MADEPVGTSKNYAPDVIYTPPVGRLPILGKIRAEVDKLRSSIADDISQIRNRDKATEDNTKKADAEIGLLTQKTITELSQTCDTLPAGVGLNDTTAVQGVIEKQKGLFQKQTDGFDRDAEQKLAKIMVDTWSVRQTTDGNATTTGVGIENANIKAVVDKARGGIGA